MRVARRETLKVVPEKRRSRRKPAGRVAAYTHYGVVDGRADSAEVFEVMMTAWANATRRTDFVERVLRAIDRLNN